MMEASTRSRTTCACPSKVAVESSEACLGVVSSGVMAPRMGRNWPVLRAHFCCNSSSVKAAFSLQNSSFSCSRTFTKSVRLDVLAIFGQG